MYSNFILHDIFKLPVMQKKMLKVKIMILAVEFENIKLINLKF